MSNEIDALFERNRSWASAILAEDPEFFKRLSELQNPEYLWIGCSDSRVPANQITGLLPGEVFVHRNIANVVVHSDLNCLSVVQYAVDVLRVRHILIVGHYGCGGVRAAMEKQRLGLVDNWLRHVHDLREKHKKLFSQLDDHDQRLRRMCEINVVEQVFNICHTTVVRDAWERQQSLTVHGMVYDVADGILKNLEVSVATHRQSHERYDAAIERIYASS
jgi:carbonic anhydrase